MEMIFVRNRIPQDCKCIVAVYVMRNPDKLRHVVDTLH